MSEDGGSKLPILLVGGALLGVAGYYLYMRNKACNISIIGGEATEWECYLKTLFGKCKWDAASKSCIGVGGDGCNSKSETDCVYPCNWCTDRCQEAPCGGGVSCNWPNRKMCYSSPISEGSNLYGCYSDGGSATGYSWQLIDSSSSSCPSGEDKYKLKCLSNVETGYEQCVKTIGETVDACWGENGRYGCACGDVDCYTGSNGTAMCSPEDDTCNWFPTTQPLVITKANCTKYDWVEFDAYIYDVHGAKSVTPYNHPFIAGKYDGYVWNNGGPWPMGWNMWVHYHTNGDWTDITTWQSICHVDQWNICPCNEHIQGQFGYRTIDKILWTFPHNAINLDWRATLSWSI